MVLLSHFINPIRRETMENENKFITEINNDDMLILWVNPESPKYPEVMPEVESQICNAFRDSKMPHIYVSLESIAGATNCDLQTARQAIERLFEFGTIVQITIHGKNSKNVKVWTNPSDDINSIMITSEEENMFRRSNFPKPELVR